MEVKEVIIYSIKEEHQKNTNQILTDLRQLVKTMDGFKDIKSYHVCDDKNKLMDHVTWESIEAAKGAVEAFKQKPEYAKIADYFNEVEHFNHYYFFM